MADQKPKGSALLFSPPSPFEPRGGSIKKVIVEILTWESQLWGKGRECGWKAKLSSLFCHFQSWYLAPPSDITLYYTSFSFPPTPPQRPCVFVFCVLYLASINSEHGETSAPLWPWKLDSCCRVTQTDSDSGSSCSDSSFSPNVSFWTRI